MKEKAESLNARVTRLEKSMASAFRAIDALADKEAKVDDVLVVLSEAQIRMTETQAKLAESQTVLGERIDKLVSAIGELIRRTG